MKVRSTLTFVAIATALAACGSTASASSTSTTLPNVTPTTVSAACNPSNPQPPKVMPKAPTADSCWAAGFYLGEGSLHNKELIWTDKQANYSVDQLTPQLIRTDPAKAQIVEKVLAEYATPTAENLEVQLISAQATAGNSLVPSGKNPSDPAGLFDTYPTIVSGGVSDIPSVTPTTAPTTALVGECADEQLYFVTPKNLPVTGLPGYVGPVQWTDQLTKTSTGWKVSVFGGGTHEVSSCG